MSSIIFESPSLDLPVESVVVEHNIADLTNCIIVLTKADGTCFTRNSREDLVPTISIINNVISIHRNSYEDSDNKCKLVILK